MRQRRAEPISFRQQRGQSAEKLVAEFLLEQGYQIVATNLRLGQLELDIVAREGPVVVVVEVRSRGERAWTTGFGSLNVAKRRRIRKAGQWLWDRRYRNDPSAERMRFDAASVAWTTAGPHLEYTRAAF